MCFGLLKDCFGSDEPRPQQGYPPQPYQQQPYQQQQYQQQAYQQPPGIPQQQHNFNQGPPVPTNTKPSADPETYKATQAAIDTYLASKKDDGEIGGIGWWQVANGYSAIALHDAYTHSPRNASVIRQQLERCHNTKPHFINEFNDDTLWWAHCLLDLYRAVNSSDPWLLDNAQRIWAHVSQYQLPHGKHFIDNGSADMGGAVLWTSKPDEDGANTITTSLFAELSARLALETPATPQDPERRNAGRYLDAAERAVGWLLGQVYRRDDHIILDGISMRKNDRCGWTFTYTTGQTIAALTLFARALRQLPSYGKAGQAGEYMQTACEIAQASVHRDIWTDSDGILVEHKKSEWNAWEGGDGWVFESVLVRSMAKLFRALKEEGWSAQAAEFRDAEGKVKQFVETQYKALRERNCSDGGKGSQYGAWWEGPFEAPTSHSQLSVLDVMAGIHAVRD